MSESVKYRSARAEVVDAACSNMFRWFAFFSTIVVVVSHISIFNISSEEMWIAKYFCAGHVYSFFFMSGFFISMSMGDENWYAVSLAKRIRTLIVPYVLWCLFYYLLKFFESPLAVYNEVFNSRDMALNKVFGLGFGTPPYNIPLWYIKCLFVFVVGAPLFNSLVENRGRVGLAMFALCVFWIAGNVCGWPFMEAIHYGFSLRGLTLFLLGMYCYRNYGCRYLSKVKKWHGVIALFVWLAFSRVEFSYPTIVLQWMLPFVCVFCMQIFVAGLFRDVSLPKYCKPIFFVFVMHMAVMRLAGKMVMPIIGVWGIAVVAIVIPLIVASLLKTFVPRAYLVLTGGRQ